jgi:hypothetical protein
MDLPYISYQPSEIVNLKLFLQSILIPSWTKQLKINYCLDNFRYLSFPMEKVSLLIGKNNYTMI